MRRANGEPRDGVSLRHLGAPYVSCVFLFFEGRRNEFMSLDHAFFHDIPRVGQLEISRSSASGTGVHNGPWRKQRRMKTVDKRWACRHAQKCLQISFYITPTSFRSAANMQAPAVVDTTKKTRICARRCLGVSENTEPSARAPTHAVNTNHRRLGAQKRLEHIQTVI